MPQMSAGGPGAGRRSASGRAATFEELRQTSGSPQSSGSPCSIQSSDSSPSPGRVPLIVEPKAVSATVEVCRLTDEVAELQKRLSLAERMVEFTGASPAARAVARWQQRSAICKAHRETALRLKTREEALDATVAALSKELSELEALRERDRFEWQREKARLTALATEISARFTQLAGKTIDVLAEAVHEAAAPAGTSGSGGAHSRLHSPGSALGALQRSHAHGGGGGKG